MGRQPERLDRDGPTAVTQSRRQQLAANLHRVRARIDDACRAAGRDPSGVVLLPVTKFFPATDVAMLYELGCREFGESREQEASAKVAEFAQAVADTDPASTGVRWHMLGRVQRNKAKSVAQWAASVHAADSVRLVDALEKAARLAVEGGHREGPLGVLIQVSLDGDVHRGGIEISALPGLAERVAESDHLRLDGLMAVPPIDSDPDAAFAQLAEVRVGFVRAHPAAVKLSAGMSADLEAAVTHGSTCVRVGTALMGPRPIISP